EQFDITLIGLSACAGYLSAIFERLQSPGPLTDEQAQEAFTRGKRAVAGRYLDRVNKKLMDERNGSDLQ
ncbi:hypothetical protein LJC26_03795, partial [Desulfovibrio sp. OttesenSCG-928-O18]|nr:hypothetical protein [Desulfovibrio sp. OttesenSCG-928-O18]